MSHLKRVFITYLQIGKQFKSCIGELNARSCLPRGQVEDQPHEPVAPGCRCRNAAETVLALESGQG